jgi:hypothetical protein
MRNSRSRSPSPTPVGGIPHPRPVAPGPSSPAPSRSTASSLNPSMQPLSPSATPRSIASEQLSECFLFSPPRLRTGHLPAATPLGFLLASRSPMWSGTWARPPWRPLVPDLVVTLIRRRVTPLRGSWQMQGRPASMLRLPGSSGSCSRPLLRAWSGKSSPTARHGGVRLGLPRRCLLAAAPCRQT